MARQPYRGNPEQKQVEWTTGFQYGMNITMSDDLLPDRMLRNLINYDLESIGELSARRGFGANTALSAVLYPLGAYHNAAVDLSTQQEVFFTLLQNDNVAWQRLADSESYSDYISHFGVGNVLRYLRLLVNKSAKTLYWEDVEITLDASPVIVLREGTMTSASFNYENILLNWQYVDKYGRIYFTNNDKGMLIFDAESDTPETPWAYVGSFTGEDNAAYKPNGVEVRKIGFNVLGTEPLSWLYESELTTETIQGIYLTTTDRKPIQVVPAGGGFQVNILYTGDVHTFTLEMNVNGEAVEATFTKNVTYSVTGSLAVYDVVLVTPPNDETEFIISFDDESVVLEPFYDYYPAGTVPADTEAVTQLNVGEFKLVEMYDRMVYYHGNALWFSEVDVYDYIPNFNYVLLPLDKTDEVTRILFFRDSYILFTKRRIYKLYGDFESGSFSLDLVNDNIGCVAANTAMVVQNEMYFVSTMGLRALKTDTFKANLENVREFDEPITPLVKGDERMYAILYKDQYVLLNNLRGSKDYAYCNMRRYQIPDQIRFYYKQGAFTTDIYAPSTYPTFMFMENGQLYSFREDGMYRFGDAYSDFGVRYQLLVETISSNFGLPAHEKKIKHILVKAGGGLTGGPMTIQVAADGAVVTSSLYTPIGTDEDGNTIFADSSPLVKDGLPVENPLGEGTSKLTTRKFRTDARGKNIAVRIFMDIKDRLTLQGIGYIFKVGKVRE